MPPRRKAAVAAAAAISLLPAAAAAPPAVPTPTPTPTPAPASAPSTPVAKRARRGAKAEEEAAAQVADTTTTTTTTTTPAAPAKQEPVVVKSEEKPKDSIINKLKEADKKDKANRVHLPDKMLPWYSNREVVDDYDCMLNQTNIGANNNKFYLIQVLKEKNSTPARFYCWQRWGRVGETGQNNGLETYSKVEDAIKSFEKKFKDKTRNDWKNRDNFVPSKGKYALIEIDSGEQKPEPDISLVAKKRDANSVYEDSKLDAATQDLLRLIFDDNMFKEELKQFDIDVKKMPLGKLSKTQIAKGFEVLEEIEDLIKSNSKSKVKFDELSSKFYTVVPHSFGRQKPPSIDSQEKLQIKYDMLTVLSDIELAQSMQEDAEKKVEEETQVKMEKLPNPIDTNYGMLKCELTLVDKNSDEFKMIHTYTKETESWPKEILEVWRVAREDELTRFKAHDDIENRKLLWHGTAVAVVVAILKTGLRIMPHSGGRVGKGIYFASENGKSSGYTRTTTHKGQNIGIMFLNEVALGKESHITRDDSSLVKPPNGYDCVIAKGSQEPDPKKDIVYEMDGKKVVVPQGKPINTKISSSFSQSEYLIYKESQNRIRYLLKIKF